MTVTGCSRRRYRGSDNPCPGWDTDGATARRLADAPHPVFVRAFEYPQGYPGFPHRHRLAQVVYPMRGAVSVETGAGTWVVGSFTAVAIPPWREHRVAAHGNASLRSVFVDTDAYPELVTDLVAVHVSELLHELIREAGRHYTDFDGADPWRRESSR